MRCIHDSAQQARKEKQSFETTLNNEITKREEELTSLWQEKVDKAISTTGQSYCCSIRMF